MAPRDRQWWPAISRESLRSLWVRRGLRVVNLPSSNARSGSGLEAAVERDEFAPFDELLAVLSRPYEDQEGFESYANPPKEDERVVQTFCGT